MNVLWWGNESVPSSIKDRLNGERTGSSLGWDGGGGDWSNHPFLLPTPVFFPFYAPLLPASCLDFFYSLYIPLSCYFPPPSSFGLLLLSIHLSWSVLRCQYFDSCQTTRKEQPGLSYGMPCVCVCVCVGVCCVCCAYVRACVCEQHGATLLFYWCFHEVKCFYSFLILLIHIYMFCFFTQRAINLNNLCVPCAFVLI